MAWVFIRHPWYIIHLSWFSTIAMHTYRCHDLSYICRDFWNTNLDVDHTTNIICHSSAWFSIHPSWCIIEPTLRTHVRMYHTLTWFITSPSQFILWCITPPAWFIIPSVVIYHTHLPIIIYKNTPGVSHHTPVTIRHAPMSWLIVGTAWLIIPHSP